MLSQLFGEPAIYLKNSTNTRRRLHRTKTRLRLHLLGKTFILPPWFLLTTRLAKTVV